MTALSDPAVVTGKDPSGVCSRSKAQQYTVSKKKKVNKNYGALIAFWQSSTTYLTEFHVCPSAPGVAKHFQCTTR